MIEKYSMDWAQSQYWLRRPDEPEEQDMKDDLYFQRMEREKKEFWQLTKESGYAVLYYSNWITDKKNIYSFRKPEYQILWSKEFTLDLLMELKREFESLNKFSIEKGCPLCFPDGGYIMRIINPNYPEGFLNFRGVATKCICLKYMPKEKDRKEIADRDIA